MWTLYILRCGDGSLYTGITKNLAQRLSRHSAGKGAKYTRGKLPVSCVYFEKIRTERSARRKEFSVKKLSRLAKLKMINEFTAVQVGN